MPAAPRRGGWNLRLFKKYGFRFTGENLAQVQLPQFGDKQKGELSDILFPFPAMPGVGKPPGILCKQTYLREKYPEWAKRWKHELYPQWTYLVPRLMLPSLDAMLSVEARQAIQRTTAKKHKEVYSFYTDRIKKLEEALGLERFLQLQKLVFSRYPAVEKGGPYKFPSLLLELQSTISVVHPGRNVYGARYPTELAAWLEEVSAGDLTYLLREIKTHYTAGVVPSPIV